MDRGLEETVLKVADYSNEEEKRSAKTVRVRFTLGVAALAFNAAMDLMELGESFWPGFLKGMTLGLAMGSMALA